MNTDKVPWLIQDSISVQAETPCRQDKQPSSSPPGQEHMDVLAAMDSAEAKELIAQEAERMRTKPATTKPKPAPHPKAAPKRAARGKTPAKRTYDSRTEDLDGGTEDNAMSQDYGLSLDSSHFPQCLHRDPFLGGNSRTDLRLKRVEESHV
ncbi:unnamed protein product [Phytophthora lilii]|uniref:Unnamed protein product n=1 Tax=Phytophthora lilii TaxID=2077276 RepID=A0A9W6WUH6_9STRA|nr:unnamed protein product [Phytophthora lilii]